MVQRTLWGLSVALVLLAAQTASAQTNCEFPRVLIVLDKSSSMNGPAGGGGTKWDAARNAVTSTVTAHGAGIHFGLMVFPDPDKCNPGTVKVNVGPNTAASMASYLAAPPPAGGAYTPMSQSLDAAGEYGPLLSGPQRNYALLITDGWQWCDPYDSATRSFPVDAVKRLRAKGVRTFVVGFGDGVDVLTLNKAAFEGGTSPAGCNPNGTNPAAADRCYFQTSSQADLSAALNQIARITSAETCDGQDNDCDGYPDNAAPGSPAPLTKACSSSCGGGTQTCQNGQWTACNAPPPQPETCNGQDEDCDGFVDNAVRGNPAPLSRACTSACGTGTERCEGGRWVGCTARQPTAETCNGQDDDCDGYADNAVAGDPAPLTRPCSSACGTGSETCIRGQWQGCTARQPVTEICGDNIDNNCDGRVDENCECQAGQTRPCGSDVGECRKGTQRCTVDGRWGDCDGQGPVAEICDGKDNDCNGVLDNDAPCPPPAICACGACASPCRNGECPQGATCTGGFCVFDRCPEGMHCEGTVCVDGPAPAPVPVDAGSGSGTGDSPDGGDPVGPGIGAPPKGCGCSASPADAAPIGAALLLLAFFILRRRP